MPTGPQPAQRRSPSARQPPSTPSGAPSPRAWPRGTPTGHITR